MRSVGVSGRRDSNPRRNQSPRTTEALTTRGVHQLIRTLGQKVGLGNRVYRVLGAALSPAAATSST